MDQQVTIDQASVLDVPAETTGIVPTSLSRLGQPFYCDHVRSIVRDGMRIAYVARWRRGPARPPVHQPASGHLGAVVITHEQTRSVAFWWPRAGTPGTTSAPPDEPATPQQTTRHTPAPPPRHQTRPRGIGSARN